MSTIRKSEDQAKGHVHFKKFLNRTFSVRRVFSRSRGLCLGPQLFQKSGKLSSISLPKEVFYPTMYTAVLHNLITGTFSRSPVRDFRPRLRLSAASFQKESGESSACQVAYLSLGVCELHEILEREGKPVVVAVPWLSTNIGSRQATLAAKKA